MHALRSALLTLLAAAGLAQTPALLPKGGTGLRTPAPPVGLAQPPARMTPAEFDALRPQVAGLLGISASALPARLTAVPALGAPGTSLTIAPGLVPADCGLRLTRGSLALGKIGPYAVGQAYCAWEAPATGQEFFDLSVPIPGPGTYLVLLQGESGLATLPVTISSLGPHGLPVEVSGPLPVAFKNGRLLAVFEVVKPASYLVVGVDVKAVLASNNHLRWRSCEISRLR